MPNRSVASITCTKPVGPNSYWHGHMTAYGTEGLEFDAPPGRDMDMADFRHLADHLIFYGPMDLGWDPRPSLVPYTPITLQDVRINCFGDQNMFDRPRFEPIKVDYPSDPVFYQSQGEASAIAKLVGMPIFARCLLPNTDDWTVMYHTADQFSRNFLRTTVTSNKPAEFLHLVIDPLPAGQTAQGAQPSSAAFGITAQHCKGNVGSVLVVHQDKRSLSALDVEALSAYCEREVAPILARTNAAQARALITRQAFSSWRDEFLKEKEAAKKEEAASEEELIAGWK